MKLFTAVVKREATYLDPSSYKTPSSSEPGGWPALSAAYRGENECQHTVSTIERSWAVIQIEPVSGTELGAKMAIRMPCALPHTY